MQLSLTLVESKNIGALYLHRLSSAFSIWQHSKGEVIDVAHGYALGDAARGLLTALLYEEDALAETYLTFIHTACCKYNEPVSLFSSEELPFIGPLSHDALGETYWAISVAERYGLNKKNITEIRKRISPYLRATPYLRPLAYAALSKEEGAIAHFHAAMRRGWERHASLSWSWPEDALTYANALLPLALLATASTEDPLFAQALQMLDFLNAASTYQGLPAPIGNNGWYPKGKGRALFDQQSVDPAYQVLANGLAYYRTHFTRYLKATEDFFTWFWGRNILGRPLIDQVNERCSDGLQESGISPNYSAESILCYLLAQAVYDEVRTGRRRGSLFVLFQA